MALFDCVTGGGSGELIQETLTNITSKTISTPSHPKLILVAVKTTGSSEYNQFSMYSNGDLGYSFNIYRTPLISNITDNGFTVSYSVGTTKIAEGYCWYML